LETIKPKMASPFPNLPYLIDNERIITESDAILFYLACLKGREDLYGVDFEEKLLLLQLRGVIKDVASEISDLIYNPNYNEQMKEEFLKEDGFIQKKLVFLNKFLVGKQFLTGSNVKYVDFWFYETIQLLQKLSPKMVEKYETFAVLTGNIRKLNGIETYLKSPRFNANKTFSNQIHSISNI